MSYRVAGFSGSLIVGSLLAKFVLSKRSTVTSEWFNLLERRFLPAYFLATLADWLQGPYVYALYAHYGFSKAEIGQLFVVGFGTSAIVGPLVGSFADSYGRKKSCLLYCLLYVVTCLTKHINNYSVLMLGRVTGGVATSILFSSFDSWMVATHHQGSAEMSTGPVFSKMVFGNGLVAIAAGVVGAIVADRFGMVAPFDVAIVSLIAAFILILFTWTENHGKAEESSVNSIHLSLRECWENTSLLWAGLVQASFESAMYIFVLNWTPALPSQINHGEVFAGFMAATMVGSNVCSWHERRGGAPEDMVVLCFLWGFVSLLVPVVMTEWFFRIVAFCSFEVAVGMYFASFYTVRAEVVSDQHRATVLNIFRILPNILVIGFCLSSGYLGVEVTLLICCGLLVRRHWFSHTGGRSV
ncbi:MAG: hypothetical protein KVP17_002845 [Porospora cf. gigantea B]|uniref:uncharacterized protein n=1 Tax=Porospora cf. gigantea B TaxID=2853592 RepID=UPI003571AB93|nr:MAG: hypothetical protein KVP17_002845 [Porospora cf. gigantea B]